MKTHLELKILQAEDGNKSSATSTSTSTTHLRRSTLYVVGSSGISGISSVSGSSRRRGDTATTVSTTLPFRPLLALLILHSHAVVRVAPALAPATRKRVVATGGTAVVRQNQSCNMKHRAFRGALRPKLLKSHNLNSCKSQSPMRNYGFNQSELVVVRGVTAILSMATVYCRVAAQAANSSNNRHEGPKDQI